MSKTDALPIGPPEAPAHVLVRGANIRSPLTRNTIVHVAEFGAPYPGSFIAALRALGVCLGRAELRQILVLPARARQRHWAADWQMQDELPLFFLSPGSLWKRAGEVAAIALRQGALLVHGHFCPADWLTWFALLRLRSNPLRRQPPPLLVWHYHSSPTSAGFARSLLGPLKYRLLSRSIHHVAVSEGILKAMLARGVPANLCRLVLNGINLQRATAPANPRAQVRSDLALGEQQTAFLLFGHDPERKGVDLALKAAAGVFNEFPDIALVIVGQEKMRRYVRERLGNAQPAWLRLAEPREAVADYYNAVEFFLSPSRSEGLPFAVLEALANRLPVISSDIPGMEWARGLEAVRLCPSGDAASLARQMRQLLVEPAEALEAPALRARDYVREHHSTEVWAREMLRVYSSLINDSAP
ncbi:MAG: hypothetical protein C5B50_16510 [Verrucomicrobia bacterium]|nr:MAG: hypothetical protein C5B50_16510 [Verrucomicrobiota bacterium]